VKTITKETEKNTNELSTTNLNMKTNEQKTSNDLDENPSHKEDICTQGESNKNKTRTILKLIPKLLLRNNKIENINKTSIEKILKEEKTKQQEKTISFVKGETINPYKQERNSSIDPFSPPIVKFTKLSMETEDKTYALARFRERTTYENVRLFLAFFHDQKDICYEGLTTTSLKVKIDQEGLPTNRKELEKLYMEYHEKIGIPMKEVKDDLEMCRNQMYNNYRDYLGKVRENWKKYMTP